MKLELADKRDHLICDYRKIDWWKDEYGNEQTAGNRCCRCYPHPSCAYTFDDKKLYINQAR